MQKKRLKTLKMESNISVQTSFITYSKSEKNGSNNVLANLKKLVEKKSYILVEFYYFRITHSVSQNLQ